MMRAMSPGTFELSVDAAARQWLDDRPQATQLFIAYLSSKACCSG
jgi:hypothetical protein